MKPTSPEPNPAKNRRLMWLDIVVACATFVLVGAGLWFSVAQNRAANSTTCSRPGQEHVLQLAGDRFTPDQLVLKRCDTIKVVNSGAEEYDLAFGVHDRHVNYPGFTMQLVRPNEFIIVSALQAGEYTMHDHLRDKAHVSLDIRDR